MAASDSVWSILGRKPPAGIGPLKHTLKAGCAPKPADIRNCSKLESVLAFCAGGMNPVRDLLIYLTADNLFSGVNLADD